MKLTYFPLLLSLAHLHEANSANLRGLSTDDDSCIPEGYACERYNADWYCCGGMWCLKEDANDDFVLGTCRF